MTRGGEGDLGTRGDYGPGRGGYPAPRYAPTLGPPGRWWDDKKMARNLSLRNDQQKRMDDIFEAGKGNLLQMYSSLQREEARFSTMSSAELSDETKVFAAIDRVAQARADVAKANAHILLQIRREMDASQLAALDREIASLR